MVNEFAPPQRLIVPTLGLKRSPGESEMRFATPGKV